jgi:hypothetical protein
MISNDSKYTREIKSRIAMEKQHSTDTRLFCSKLDLNLWKQRMNCCIWSKPSYSAESWTLESRLEILGRFLSVVPKF